MKQKKQGNKRREQTSVREGGEWEGREKRGKGREESREGRGTRGQKEFDKNKQTNKQTNTCTNTQKDKWK